MNREQAFTLTGILLALFLGALDQTIVATALPKIVEDLQGVSRYSWVATAYLVASTALVPVYGKLADMYSRKMIELFAIGLFLMGSFLCGLSGEFGRFPLIGDGMNQLIIFRSIQGMGGAGLFAMAFIIIADLFPPAERGKYQGFVGAVFGISSVLGPWIGGLLTDYGGVLIPGIAGWRWVFYVNVPFGALALWFIITRMPTLQPAGEKQKLNYLSALLLIAGMVPLVVALQVDKMKYPWGSAFTLGLLAVAVVLLVLFVFQSLRVPNPMLDFQLFRNKVFRTANLALFLLGSAFLSIVIFLPLFMVNVVGVSATKAGVSLIPLSLGVVFGSVVSGQLVSRFGHYKRWMLIGLTLLFAGVFLLSQMSPSVQYWQVILYMSICGIGLGPSMPLYTLAIQNAVDIRKIGQATSATQFFRQIGGAIGTALMGTILATSLAHSFSSSMPGFPGGNRAGKMQMAASQLESSGGANIDKNIHDAFDHQYGLLEEAIKNDDQQAKDSLLHNSLLPDQVRQSLKEGKINVSSLPAIKKQFDRNADEVARQASAQVQQAFGQAVTKVYFFTLFIVAAGWLATWFVPELKLRKTNDIPQSPEVVAEAH